VTVDCGSTAYEAVATARKASVDVIVTDHHLPAQPLPSWVIEINPRREVCSYPFEDLAGAGVALKLALAVAERFEMSLEVTALLRVACLGTVCDLVPLVGENRVIARLGLAALPETPSVGLRALVRTAGIRAPFTASDVGYRLGPRINAAGRMDTADAALELLLTRDRERARQLAARLEEWNRARQQAEQRVVDQAFEEISKRRSPAPIVVAWRTGWHPGVLGIAAGRIARELWRPTLLLTVDGEVARGSGRSIKGIQLHQFLSRWGGDFQRFGGHAQAIGLTLEAGRLEALREEWEEAARDWQPELLRRRRVYELQVSAGDLDEAFLTELEKFEPFGVGNPQPVLRVGPLCLSESPRTFGRGHLNCRGVAPDGAQIAILGWGWVERQQDLAGQFEALGCLERDRFTERPVLRLLDVRPYRDLESALVS
jgi:single-stranded-DNA-specific exonuclease